MMSIKILTAVHPDQAERYLSQLSQYEEFAVEVVTHVQAARESLSARDHHIDIFVIDYQLGNAHEFINELRHSYPRLLIILVDEEADFGLPGQADELSTDPFADEELARRIKRLMSDRKTETLRSDSLPAVRQISKHMRSATGAIGKQEAAVEACAELGYDYVAYYHTTSTDPLRLELRAHRGPKTILPIVPKEASADDLMGWVAQNSQSRIAAPEDSPNHPLVARGRLGAVACVPVYLGEVHYGVIAACRDRPGSITQDNVLMLELVGVQLATALGKDE